MVPLFSFSVKYEEAAGRQRGPHRDIAPPDGRVHHKGKADVPSRDLWVHGPNLWNVISAGRFPVMTLYYFDVRVGDDLYPDEEGLELPDLRTAEAEAALALAELAREQVTDADRHQMAIEVRTADDGPLFRAAFIFELSQMKH